VREVRKAGRGGGEMTDGELLETVVEDHMSIVP
jgi:hypothetical protein